MKPVKKASRAEIFTHLLHLLGDRSEEIAICSAEWILEGRKEDGIQLLMQYDRELGGVGIHCANSNKKLPGIYRALTYVIMPLHTPHPENFTRGMIHAACAYLEELLKKVAWVWPWEEAKQNYPLGTMVERAKKRFEPRIYAELAWLSQNVYNCAKHDYNLESEGEEEPQHFFTLDEAIAVYLICRKLGLEIEQSMPEKIRAQLTIG